MNAPLKTEGLYFSVTQLKSWLMCPRKYEYRYVRGVEPELVPMNLAFGLAWHEALAHHYSWLKLESPLPAEEVKQRFVDSLIATSEGPVPLENDEDGMSLDAAIEKGRQMLDVVLAHPVASAKVLAVEQKFTVDLHHPVTGEVLEERLTGVIDLVTEEEGRRVLVEHKTASKKWGPDQLRFDTQLSAYAYAAEQLTWGDPALRFSVVTKTKVPAVQVEDVRRDDGDVRDFLHQAYGVLKAIDAGVSFPIRGWQCRTCPYRRRCESER